MWAANRACRMELGTDGLFHGLRILGDPGESNPREALRLAVTLLLILKRIQREAKLFGKLRLARFPFAAEFADIHLRYWHLGDSHVSRLTIHPVAGLPCARQ